MSADWKDDDFFEEMARHGQEHPEVPLQEPSSDLERLGRVRDSRLKLVLRTMVFVGALVACGHILRLSLPDLEYFLSRGQAPVELGDLRSPEFRSSVLDGLPSNALVSFRNDVITMDRIRTKEHEFYFSPLSKSIVRTAEALPDKSAYELLTNELDPWETDLVLAKKAFPEDFQVTFEGTGRFLHNQELPSWTKPLLAYYSKGSGTAPDQIHLIMDGELPQNQWPALVICLAALLIIFITLGLFIRALGAYLKASKGVRV
jgi:hypothetical protein